MQPTYMEQNELGSGVLASEKGGLTAKGLEDGTLKRQSEILAEMAPQAVPCI